jgi:hypothetical protein
VKITEAQRRALEQVHEAGKHGLQVEIGWESVTQRWLVEQGLLWQEHGDFRCWKFTLSNAGRSALQPPATEKKTTGEPE